MPILPIQAKLSEKELIEKYILGPDGLRKVVVNAKNEMQKYPNGGLLPRPAAIPPKQQTEGFSNQLMKNFNSSRTLFKPDRYLQTRGISVSFDEINDTGSKLQLQSIEETDGARGRSSKLYVGKVLTQKLAFRESVTDKVTNNLETSVLFYVNKSLTITLSHPPSRISRKP